MIDLQVFVFVFFFFENALISPAEKTLDPPQLEMLTFFCSVTVADLKKFRVDYSVHGDDISIGADGLDCHSETKTAGMYKIIRRTRGISTTTILGALIRLVTQRETREVNGNYNHSQQNSNCDENTSLGEVRKTLSLAPEVFGRFPSSDSNTSSK